RQSMMVDSLSTLKPPPALSLARHPRRAHPRSTRNPALVLSSDWQSVKVARSPARMPSRSFPRSWQLTNAAPVAPHTPCWPRAAAGPVADGGGGAGEVPAPDGMVHRDARSEEGLRASVGGDDAGHVAARADIAKDAPGAHPEPPARLPLADQLGKPAPIDGPPL